jgi:hypothetical protein
VPLYFLWCISRERNNRSFEDRERKLSRYFNTLYLWAVNVVSPLMISYHDFLVFLVPTS